MGSLQLGSDALLLWAYKIEWFIRRKTDNSSAKFPEFMAPEFDHRPNCGTQIYCSMPANFEPYFSHFLEDTFEYYPFVYMQVICLYLKF